MMRRDECAALIHAALAPDDLVVVSLGTVNRAWRAVGASQPSYFCSDPMGLSSSIALGLALARPDRRVVLICGDGDLLMALGSLVTIAGANIGNLRICVFCNGRYETGGGQKMAGSSAMSLPSIALGAGFGFAAHAANAADAAAQLRALLAHPGVGLLGFAVAMEAAPYPPAGPLSQAEERLIFQQKLGAQTRDISHS